MSSNRARLFTVVFVAFLAGVVSASAGPIGPSPYLSAADSPFAGISFDKYFHLEDFEDGLLNVPGLSASAGVVVGPFRLRDSVDGDDGAIDGSGLDGHAYYSAGHESLTFNFSRPVLRGLPTHVGLVWTDGSTPPGFGVTDVEFEAFDQFGASLGLLTALGLGDGEITGGTAEDRFFGFIHTGGISRLRVTNLGGGDWELDHVQYGRVPEPSSLLLMGVGLVGLATALRARLRRS